MAFCTRQSHTASGEVALFMKLVSNYVLLECFFIYNEENASFEMLSDVK